MFRKKYKCENIDAAEAQSVLNGVDRYVEAFNEREKSGQLSAPLSAELGTCSYWSDRIVVFFDAATSRFYRITHKRRVDAWLNGKLCNCLRPLDMKSVVSVRRMLGICS